MNWIPEDSLKSWQFVVDTDRKSRVEDADYAAFGREVIPTLIAEVHALNTLRKDLGRRVAKCDALASENDNLKWAWDKFHKTSDALRLLQAENARLRLALEQVGPADESATSQ